VGQPGRVPLLVDPLPVRDRRLLRTAVLTLARTEHRHSFPPVLHVGTPGGPTVTVTDDRAWDHGLRTDLVGALLRLLDDPPWVWVARSGSRGLQDADAAWLAASVAAAHERGSDPAFVVVTRHGWRDPRSGTGQQWRRIRQR
jgi:hypothetical protein